MSANPLQDIADWAKNLPYIALPSICSAHPIVIEAALKRAQKENIPALIEATCNQVNQDGGYTGMKPEDFRAFVEEIARSINFDCDQLILGGDHLGPNPWTKLPAEKAMAKAECMIEAFARAGFTKLHLDTSMSCVDDPVPLPDAVIAERATRLAQRAESVCSDLTGVKPVYIIGTEVPVPGGALEELEGLQVTKPADALNTMQLHQTAFIEAGIEGALERVIAVVVQPGVEFSGHDIIDYDREAATELSKSLSKMPGCVFEAHSTDYQNDEALKQLAEDGFAILKVGPGLTFSLRQALYALDHIAHFLFPKRWGERLMEVVERVMISKPENWAKYYLGDVLELQIQRHYSYSDRIRYYWPEEQISAKVNDLFDLLDDYEIPEVLVSQYMPESYRRVRSGHLRPFARDLVIDAVDEVLQSYFKACKVVG